VELAADGRFNVLEMLTVLALSIGWSSPAESCRLGGRYSLHVSRPRMRRALVSASPDAPPDSRVTHQSHNSHPRKVAKLLHPTTETGLTRSWKMPTKQTTKIMTEQTCWTMTVESATRGQKS
jgi:hypothetical protein